MSHIRFKGSIKTASTRSHRTLISPQHLCNSITSPITNHHHHQITNSSNHLPHLYRNLATQTPRARSPAICNSDPGKLLMCYEATIASVGGDEATLTKPLIISLEDVAANWYSRLPPGCIYFWQQLKEKFLRNFQGF
jgi:hypothetical protein